jgi:hypothetical protein
LAPKPITAKSSSDVDEDLLISALEQEEKDAATYYASEIAREQAVATDRYFARPYGDGSEVPNRSQVVTRDIQDAVNWVMPHLMRHFAQNDDLLTCIDDGLDPDDEDQLDDAAAYLQHVWFRDNRGEEVVHDFIFDGLTVKYGVIRTSWEPADPKPPEVLERLTTEQVLRYANDPRYKILAASQDGVLAPDGDEPDADDAPAQPQLPPPQGSAPGLMGNMPGPPAPAGLMAGQPQPQMLQPVGPEPTFSIQVQRIAIGKGRVETIPPEEFRIARRARSIEESAYHGWHYEDFVANLRRDHPDKAELLDDQIGLYEQALGLDTFYDERLTARFPDELDNGVARVAKEPERRRAVINIEYIRGDFDNDGVVELRRVKRTGKLILENDIVEESEFTMWSPIRVSHRAIGISIADTLMDIQKIRTVLTRKAMDSLSQSLAPRTAVNAMAAQADPGLIDRLLDHEVGDVIPVSGEPGKIIMPLVTPDVSASAFQAIEYWDRRSEEASGVNRHAMGIQPQAITDTAKGINDLQQAANTRIEQYARWAAHGLEVAFGKLLRLLIAHQDQARVVKINGRRLTIDPRRWSDEMTVKVHVGMAAESREKKLQYLAGIAAKQEQILMQAGPSNPLVSLKQYRNTLAAMATAMGEKTPERYFAEIPDNWQPPPPGPDPKTQEAQAKLQLEAQKAQADQQLKTQQFAHETQLSQSRLAAETQAQQAKMEMDAVAAERDAGHKRELQALQIESDARLAQAKAVAEAQLAQQKIDAETMLARERMAAEMELARWKAAQDVKVRRAQIAALPNDKGLNGSGPGVRFGGQVG